MSFPNSTCSLVTVLYAFTCLNMKMVKKNVNLPIQNMCEFPGLHDVCLFVCVLCGVLCVVCVCVCGGG